MESKLVQGFAMLRPTTRRVVTAVLASSLLISSASVLFAAPNEQAGTAASLTAKWVPRKIHFMYSAAPSSESTYYSCEKLQGAITTILQQLGAREEVVKPFGCMSNGGPERFPGVDATFSVLEPAGSASQVAASSRSVEARWEKVTLSPDASCELIEQAKRHILPLFATRNQTSGCSPRFSLEVLRPVKS